MPKITSKVHEKYNKKTINNQPQIDQNPSKIDGFEPLVRKGSWSVLGRLGVSRQRQGAFRGRLGRVLGRLGSVLAANMAPTWPPKWNQNRIQIDAKIDQKKDAFWDRLLGAF